MKPTDPIEGVLISQIVTANEAALEFYRRGWTNTDAGYFDAGTKYLQLADKAARTVAMLTERLDRHRGQGQQQITVKHVTVNADQAALLFNAMSIKSRLLTQRGQHSPAFVQLARMARPDPAATLPSNLLGGPLNIVSKSGIERG